MTTPKVVIHRHMATTDSPGILVAFLTQVRKCLRIRQIDLAGSMKTSPSSIIAIEKHVKDPRLSTILRYAAAIGAEIEITVSVDPQAVAILEMQPNSFLATPETPSQSEPWQAVVESLLSEARTTGLQRPKIRVVQSVDSPSNSEGYVEIIVVLPARTAESEQR